MNETKPVIGRVTIRTVAADAGVSVAAVSKVLRNAYGVSDALRQGVMQSIDRLGYRPSTAARGMRGQTYTIGVLLVDISNPFLPQVYDGIASVAETSGYKILMAVGAARMPIETKLIEQMIDIRLDGIVLIAAQISGRTLDKYARQIPISVVGHHEPTAESFDTVNSNDIEGARIVVRALIAKGYRDIGMVSMGTTKVHEHDVAPQREKGFRAAIAEAGLGKANIFRFDNQDAARMAKMADLLRSPQRPQALFCWSDLDGIPVLNLARQMGLRVPQDLALIGYDNSPVASLPLIDLASMDQAGRRLGQIATQALLSRMNGRSVAEHRLIDPTLAVRSSF